MHKKYVVLGTYNHVPGGIDSATFETIYQTCYRPFLSVLYRFPELQVALHYSGELLKRLEDRHPEFLMLLEEMIGRKQVELVGGGYYAPILPLVAVQDRLGQIEMLTTFIRKHFGKRPRGCWISEYAWEPPLASSLKTSGMDYSFLLDKHFEEAGIRGEGLFAPVLTEDQGKTVAVLPTFDGEHSFGRLMGFSEMLAEVERVYSSCEERHVTVLMLPGESADRLWRQAGVESPDVYFEKTFNDFRKSALEYETVSASRIVRGTKRFARAYFPCCATSTLLSSSGARATQGFSGSVRRPLLSCQESVNLYAKMQYVHLLVGQLRGDKSRKKSAQEELWSAQNGSVYWRAPRGGIEDLSVRAQTYAALIEAEKTTRSKGQHAQAVIHADVDFDGEKEILFQGNEYNAYVHLRGGVLFELDMLRAARNAANSFVPHDGESGSPRGRCFADFIEASGSDGLSIAEDCSIVPFGTREARRPNAEVILFRELRSDKDPKRSLVLVEKTYAFKRNSMHVIYALTNKSEQAMDVSIRSSSIWTPVVEATHLSLGVSESDRTHDVDASETRAFDGISRIAFLDRPKDIAFSLAFDKPAAVMMNEVIGAETIGNARCHQGLRADLTWRFPLKPEKTWQVRIVVEFAPAN